MAQGPGIYDDMITFVREQLEASAVILMVFDGNKGSGFSVQGADLAMLERIPGYLRHIADELEQGRGDIKYDA